MLIEPRLEKIGYAGTLRILASIMRAENVEEHSFYSNFIDIRNDMLLPNPSITLDEKVNTFAKHFDKYYDSEPNRENHKDYNKIETIKHGVYITETLNIDHDFDYIRSSFDDLKTKTDMSYRYMNSYPGSSNETDDSKFIPFSYGVCDNADDILNFSVNNYYDEEYYTEEDKEFIPDITLEELLAKSDRQYVITLTPMCQEEQPEEGGWRWHKWGAYIGKHNVQCEYLYDEDLSDISQTFVYVFHIYEFLDNGDTINKVDFSDELSDRICSQFLKDGLNLNNFTVDVSFDAVGATIENLLPIQEYIDDSFAYYDSELELLPNMNIKYIIDKIKDAYKIKRENQKK